MTEPITVEELTKASRNVERLSEFIGERRSWMLASDAGDAASRVVEAAESLDAVILKMIGGDSSEEIAIRHPSALEPSARVTAGRLVRFAEFIEQLKKWFSAHSGTELPEGATEPVQNLRTSLASTIDALAKLRGASPDDGGSSDPLITNDLGPVAEVDMTARLKLDNTVNKPLLQVFRGVTELSPTAAEMVDEFFAKQGVKLEGPERRRFHDKVLRWIQSTPDGQILVVRLSGLSGKPEAYSSYKPK